MEQAALFRMRSTKLTLEDRFLVPPFSVLDTKAGYWRERKRQWVDLGIKSEEGRDAALLGYESLNNDTWASTDVTRVETQDGRTLEHRPKGQFKSFHTTSIFDPVLCEIVYRWFSPPGGKVLDPFAGGSVRGIVAARLRRHYYGIDLRYEQCRANAAQAQEIDLDDGPEPMWFTGDSREVLTATNYAVAYNGPYDLIFSCPPYYDLEQYSDDPKDLSNASDYEAFLEGYRAIIADAVGLLADDRFACFVVADVRGGKHGYYQPLVRDTVAAFEDAGAAYYNEGILVTAVGSLAVRIGRQFGAGRKLGRMHQNVLFFCKGDPKAATAAIGPVETALEEQGEAAVVWGPDGTSPHFDAAANGHDPWAALLAQLAGGWHDV